MITATLYGRIARDPEQMQPSNGGESYVRFSMAVETGRKDQDGNRIAQFINISVFGKQGDVICQYFHKGNRIVCHVRNLETRAYADQSGQPRANLQAVLAGIEFVETRADQEQQGRTADPLRGTVRRSRIAQHLLTVRHLQELLPLRRHFRACRYKDLFLLHGTREVLTDGRR